MSITRHEVFGFITFQRLYQRHGTPAVFQCFVSFFREDLACTGQASLSRKALEELCIEVNFDGTDLTGQRGWRHMASLRRACKAVLLGNSQEVFHLPQLDLCLHILNVSENGNVDDCFFERIISSRAIIEKPL